MTNSELQKQEKLLELKTATPKNLAKYGHLIQSPLKLDNGNTPYYGEAVVTTPIPFLSFSKIITPQPPGPGLFKHAPSVYISITSTPYVIHLYFRSR